MIVRGIARAAVSVTSPPRWGGALRGVSVANSNVAGGYLAVIVFEIADAATADYSVTLSQTLEVFDVEVIKT